MSALVARARGLATRALPAELVACVPCDPDGVERLLARRLASDLAILVRWAGRDRPLVDALVLDEDRRSIRGIVRGLAGNVAGARRIDGAIPTPSLPVAVLEQLARATSIADIAHVLEGVGHPLAVALAKDATDLLAIEVALARELVDRTRAARRRDSALDHYLGALVDGENAAAALLLAARGGTLEPAAMFLEGGRRLDRATFVQASGVDVERARERLARVFAGTAIASALYQAATGAIEDAILDDELATQARSRRTAPTGFAAVLHLWLVRRGEARQLRRTAWRAALGGAA